MAAQGSDRHRRTTRATESASERAPAREAGRDGIGDAAGSEPTTPADRAAADADRATDRMIDRARSDVDARIAAGREPRTGPDTLARAAAETRETERARSIRGDDDERTARRQDQLEAMERDGEATLRSSGHRLSRTGDDIADTHAQIREGTSGAREIERRARALNEGAQRLLDDVRATMPRTTDGAPRGDDDARGR